MKKYQIIYADPPWEYRAAECFARDSGSCLSGDNPGPYNYMSISELSKLPIYELGVEDCLLFLWVTGPKLDEAIPLAESWGFKYATIGFVWEKQLTNPGYYTMSSVEICLILKKGRIPIPRGRYDIKQFLSEKRRKHSQKPDTIKDRIIKMFPTQIKIELFARQKTPGWDVWGNEVESDINLTDGSVEKAYREEKQQELATIVSDSQQLTTQDFNDIIL